MSPSYSLIPLAIVVALGMPALAQTPSQDVTIPASISDWVAEGEPSTYDQKSVFDYLDGGAEVYLAYGMKSVRALRYTRSGEPSIDLSIFEMETPESAFGTFTYERLDAEAGIGQGSEYGAGILRFFQGHYFVFIQAERENPASREAVLTLGKLLASRLGPEAGLPALCDLLPQQGLRPLTTRYVISPLLLKNLEPTLNDNPLNLPARTAAVMGRYWTPGNPERVIIARFPDAPAASKGVESYVRTRIAKVHKPMEPFRSRNGWSIVTPAGNFAILILDAPDATVANKQCEAIKLKLKETAR